MKIFNFSTISRLLITAALAFPFTAFANTAPTSCPTVATLKAAGLYFAYRDNDDNAFVVSSVGKIGSDDNAWGFGIMVPYAVAVDEQDAMNKAMASLSTISGEPEPFQDETGKWYCLYQNTYGYPTGAITPVG